MKRTKTLRYQLKKIYARKKREDSQQIGVKKNDYVQVLHMQNKLPAEKRDQELIKKCSESLKALIKERKITDDFPSFSKFYAYFVDNKNGFTLDDLKDL